MEPGNYCTVHLGDQLTLLMSNLTCSVKGSQLLLLDVYYYGCNGLYVWLMCVWYILYISIELVLQMSACWWVEKLTLEWSYWVDYLRRSSSPWGIDGTIGWSLSLGRKHLLTSRTWFTTNPLIHVLLWEEGKMACTCSPKRWQSSSTEQNMDHLGSPQSTPIHLLQPPSMVFPVSATICGRQNRAGWTVGAVWTVHLSFPLEQEQSLASLESNALLILPSSHGWNSCYWLNQTTIGNFGCQYLCCHCRC